jgi:hypothetical protein
VALTEAKIKNLADKEFDELFADNIDVWGDLAQRAFTYAKTNITGGREPRPDDVAKVLEPMLEVNENLRNHQEDKHAKAPRYVLWFTEYVIDRCLYGNQPNENQ